MKSVKPGNFFVLNLKIIHIFMLKDFKVYVISLKSAVDRRRLVEEQLNSLGIEFEFFDAYDKYRSREYLKTIGKHYKRVERDNWWARLGCKISHTEVIRMAMARANNRILVLEDDIIIREGFKESFDTYVQSLPENWGICLFGYYIKDKNKVSNPNVSTRVNDMIYTVTETHGAHCVGYNLTSKDFKNYFDALNSRFDIQEHYDLEMHKICNRNNITRYCVYPQFTAQANGMSYINKREKYWDIDPSDPRYDLFESKTIK